MLPQSLVPHTNEEDVLCFLESVVQPKQFLGKGYTGWFTFSFPIINSFHIHSVVAGCIITGSVAVPLMQCPLLGNLLRVPAIAPLLFEKDTVGSLTYTK